MSTEIKRNCKRDIVFDINITFALCATYYILKWSKQKIKLDYCISWFSMVFIYMCGCLRSSVSLNIIFSMSNIMFSKHSSYFKLKFFCVLNKKSNARMCCEITWELEQIMILILTFDVKFDKIYTYRNGMLFNFDILS